jgi:dsRNA-specific ribonuclease
LFSKLQKWANIKNLTYRFDDVISSDQVITKYCYFGDDLVGIGVDASARKAKIKCVEHALDNLKEGRTAKKTFAPNGKY